MEQFKCSICNQVHKFSSVIEFPLPRKFVVDMYHGKIDYQSNDRWFIIDNKFFLIRCELQVPVTGCKTGFSWFVWVALSQEDFVSFINKMTSENILANFSGEGRLFTEINSFEECFGEKVTYYFKSLDNYPEIEFLNEEASLNKKIKEGFSIDEAKTLMSKMYH